MFGALTDAICALFNAWQNFPCTDEKLSSYTEGNQDVGDSLKIQESGHQEIFMAAITISRRIGVVLEFLVVSIDSVRL